MNEKMLNNASKIGIYFLLLFSAWIVSACGTHSSDNAKVSEPFTAAPLCGGLTTWTAFDSLQTPILREQIGNSDLQIITVSANAQKWFNQGVNLLHGFWHVEAYRAFRQVILLDSSCAMGYWGIAMCQPGFGSNDSDIWTRAIDKANRLKTNSPPFHRALIEASTVLVKQGIEAAQVSFRNLYLAYPHEPEAVAFASIILRQHLNETTQQEVKQLLEKVLIRYPNHTGLLHYYLHVMELRPEFIKAMPMAKKLAKLAAQSPHLVHMQGHLYFLAGQYNKAVEVFENARQQELSYHKAENIPLASNQNYLHSLHFLTVAQAEQGHYQAALKTAKQFAYSTLNPRYRNEGAALMLLYEGRILPALVHIRFRQWEEAEKELTFWLHTPDAPLTSPLVRAYLEAMRAYVNAMKQLVVGSGTILPQQQDAATKYGLELTQWLKQYEQYAQSYQQKPEWKNINETYDIMNMARYELAGWIDNVDTSKPFNNAAWQEAFELEKAIAYDEPPRLMYPIAESLARLYLYRHNKQGAKEAMAKALQKRPKSPFIQQLSTTI